MLKIQLSQELKTFKIDQINAAVRIKKKMIILTYPKLVHI